MLTRTDPSFDADAGSLAFTAVRIVEDGATDDSDEPISDATTTCPDGSRGPCW